MKGVYKITNTIDGKVYVGSTEVDFGIRWSKHKSALRSGKHGNRHLQNAWNKYGESAFVFGVLETASDRSEIRTKELSWIARFFGKNCYNVTIQVGGPQSDFSKAGILGDKLARKVAKMLKSSGYGRATNKHCFHRSPAEIAYYFEPTNPTAQKQLLDRIIGMVS